MGLDAIGDQIQLLTAGGERLENSDGKLLCEYVKAAVCVHKDDREERTNDQVKELTDVELERLIEDEVRRDPRMIKRIMERAKVDLGRIS